MARIVSVAKNCQADLTVVDVVPEEVVTIAAGLLPDGPSADELKAQMAMDRRRTLASLVAPFEHVLDIQIDVVTGRRFLEVFRMVLADAFDLIVKPPGFKTPVKLP